MPKMIRMILAATLVLCLLCGCKTEEMTEKTVSVEGFSITMPAEMIDIKSEGVYTEWEMAYGYGGTEILVEKVLFSQFEDPAELPTPLEYAEWIAWNNQAAPVYVSRDEPAIVSFELVGETENYTYYVAVYKGSDAFWNVFVSCPTPSFRDMETEFMAILDSVKVS